jgi:hypothetical protein
MKTGKLTKHLLPFLRVLGAGVAVCGVAFGLLVPNHRLTLIGLWSCMCAVNTHRFMSGSSVIGISSVFDAKREDSQGLRIFSLALWWVPLLIVMMGLSVAWIQAQFGGLTEP